jgi:hypothetical protein
MGIVGDKPESGVRIEVERPREGGPPWRYEGHAVTASERIAVAATVTADGEASVEVAEGAPAGLAEKLRLLVRAAWKHASEEGAPPPRRIVRWRSDR